MNKTAKITLSTIISLLLVLSIFSIGLYVIIAYFMPAKFVETTLYSSTLSGVADENKKWVITVDYWANEDNTGVELLDIQFNNYMDVNAFNTENIYTKGMQIVGSENGSIKFDKKSKSINYFFGDTYWKYNYESENDIYFYDKTNNSSFQSLKTITNDYIFKISVGENENAELYGMKFLGFCEPIQFTQELWRKGYKQTNYDINYFAYLMYDKVAITNSENYDSDGYLQVEMSDDFNSIFTFAKYENDSFSNWLTSTSEINDRLINIFRNYFTIRLRTHYTGAKMASDSLFNMIGGDSNFEIIDSNCANDYFNGIQTIGLDEYSFEYAQSDDFTYSAEFTEETISLLEKYANNDISILVNIDNLKTKFDFETITYQIDDKYKSKITSFYELTNNEKTGVML